MNRETEAKREKIMTVPGPGRIDIFFDENLYLTEAEELSDIALSTVMNGTSTGFDISRADLGHICCYYNPTRMELSDAERAVKMMTEYIISCRA